MAPKSETLVTRSVKAITPKSPEEAKEIKRDEIFSQFDKPLGFEQETFNIMWLGVAHAFAAYCFYVNYMGLVPSRTLLFELPYGYLGGLGITVGCHRYWTHKTFKANLPLQYIMMVLQTIANQYPIHKWSLDHRIHHKYTDTDADPHNSTRGFWFSHMGWLFLSKHDDLKQKLKTFDMSDLEKDPVVRFQSKWYWTLVTVFQFVLPISVIYYVFELPLVYCIACNYRRYVVSLHFTWCVNSIAHMWGDKPYDKSITPVENAFVSFIAVGEGWHNYHHTFPWDYKASEFGWKINLSTAFIDFFAWLGWAYDMKTVSQKMLKERLRRTGDGSHSNAMRQSKYDTDIDFDYRTPADVTELMKSMDKPIWGWDDDKLPDDFREVTKILRPEGRK